MYSQQRDEYLEHVCRMALRKITILTMIGNLTSSSFRMDHYQMENEKSLRVSEALRPDLVLELRKEFGMTYNHFFMVLTDLDMKVKQYYEVPIAMAAVFALVDTFPSRLREMEREKREGSSCTQEDRPLRSLENFLARFRWRRRLFVISSPSDEDWSYQQQLYSLSGQACNLGLRHIAILKLLGLEVDAGGVVELYSINGSSKVERESVPPTLARDIRSYLQVSGDHFSMLLLGKDGNVKSWYPAPTWSMAVVYDLVDSMQLRRQEMAIQQSLGMRCPEVEYSPYTYHQHQQHQQEDHHHY